MLKECLKLVLGLILLILILPLKSYAAEVLQVRDSLVLQIGDQNRNYMVRLVCLEVDPSKELSAREFLKSKLPRGKKINFRPQGTDDGFLLARVQPLGMDKDLSKELIDAGLAKSVCD